MKKILQIFTCLFILFNGIDCFGQNVKLDWAQSMGPFFGGAGGKALVVDDSGNIYITGSFTDTVDFDSSLISTYNLISNGGYDIFILKLDTLGNFIWAKSLGGVSDDISEHMAFDDRGNIIITGGYRGIVDFDPNFGLSNLSSNGGTDAFILKLDPNGDFIWAKSMGGTSDDMGYSISSDYQGNVFTIGEYYSTVDFDPGAGLSQLTSEGLEDVFVQKLKRNGDFIWAKSIGGTGSERGTSLANDQIGNVYLTGYYIGTVDFNPNGGVYNLITDSIVGDLFILKLNGQGSFEWCKSTQSNGGNDHAYGYPKLVLDSLENVCITGQFRGLVDFDPSHGISNLHSGNGFDDVFVLKLDNSGDFIWVKHLSTTNHSVSQIDSYGIIADQSSNLYVTGSFSGTVDVDPSSSIHIINGNYSFEKFIVKLDSLGSFIWGKRTQAGMQCSGRSIATDQNGNIYTTGAFQGQCDFDPSDSIFNLNSGLYTVDLFIDKMSTCIIDTSLNVSGLNISANLSGATYQWIYCVNGYEIPGETGQSFTPIYNGVYAVEISENGCSSRSSCITINSLSVTEDNILNGVVIYPNPTQGMVNIDFGIADNFSLSIYDVLGQKIHHVEDINESNYKLDIFEPSGIYFIEVKSKWNSKMYKLIKK